MPRTEIFDDAGQFASRAAAWIAGLIAAKNGRFRIALTGGETPRALYRELGVRFRDSVDWADVEFFWGDERFVPPDSPHSNYRMARETLLSQIPALEKNIHPIPTGGDPESKRFGNGTYTVAVDLSGYHLNGTADAGKCEPATIDLATQTSQSVVCTLGETGTVTLTDPVIDAETGKPTAARLTIVGEDPSPNRIGSSGRFHSTLEWEQPFGIVDMKYITNLKTPTNQTVDYDTVFAMTLANVRKTWLELAPALAPGDRSVFALKNADLDTGEADDDKKQIFFA